MPTRSDYLQLHFIILLNSFIPRVFIEISVPSIEIVFLRTLTAVVILGAYIWYKKYYLQVETKHIVHLLLTGVLTAAYWILLSDSAKASNASVTLVGIATTSLWVSIINFIWSNNRPGIFQIITGFLAILGVYLIYNSKFEYDFGFTLAIIAAFAGGLLTVLNAKLAKIHNHYVVAFYQMIGASFGAILFAPIYMVHNQLNLNPTHRDFILIIGLAFVFSVYSYSVFIKVMKRISAFVVALTANLSPIYGILIALLLFHETERMDNSFYMGAIVILIAVFAYPILEYQQHTPHRKRRR